MKNKIISIILFIVFIFTVSGCGELNNEQYRDGHEETRQALMDVYNCLLEGDKNKLKSLLCAGLQNQNDVDEQIDAFFDNIGGRIKSGDTDDFIITRLEKSKSNGKITTEFYSGIMRNIISNNDVKYGSLSIGYCTYNKPKPELKGLYIIGIGENLLEVTYTIAHKDCGVAEQTEQERSVTELTQEQENEAA